MEQLLRAVAKAKADGHAAVLEQKASPSPSAQPRELLESTETSPVPLPLNRQPFAPETSQVSLDAAPDTLPLNPRALEANRIVSWNKSDARTPAFDVLRTKVLKAMKAHGWQTLAVTSPTQDCGKTTVSINLAFSIAHQMSSEVLLADLDLRQPRVAPYLGIKPSSDLTEFLEGGPLTTYVVNGGGARLRVLPNTGIRRNATELLSQSRADSLFEMLKAGGTLNVGVFDLPPLLSTDDALAVIPSVDCVLLVVAEGQTKKAEVTEALSLMAGANLLGVVFNKSRTGFLPYY